jgi:UDP-glucose-4-epimerase GalE
MKVLVTGGAGYIGSHAVRALQRRGHQVRIYDNLSTGHRFLAGSAELVVGDLGDSSELAPALKGIDAVMHFAASCYVGESVKDPRDYFRNNVESGLNFLNHVLDARIRTFIQSSTCATYGLPAVVPIKEDSPRQPVNPYGASKLFFENALEAYATAYGLRYVAFRYFNASGADESGEIGELHDPETHLVPRALQAATGQIRELEIFGNDYPTPDGTCIRDYIHVNDLAEAHALGLEYLAAGGESTTLNLGTGSGHSVNEVITACERTSRRPIRRRVGPRRPGDPPLLVADASKAHKVLRWKALRNLNDIVATAWKWHEKVLQGSLPLAGAKP